MKKMLLRVLLLLILLSACSAPPVCCSPETSEAPPEPFAPQTETARPSIPKGAWTYDDMVVGFLQLGAGVPWRDANTASFRDTAKELGITLKHHETQATALMQHDGFRRFIQDPEVNVIVLAAVETGPWEDELMNARAAGKVVIVVERPIDAPDDLYAAYVGYDFIEEGRRAGEEMCKLLEGMPGKNVWELVGTPGAQASIDRSHGFREKMQQCGIQITRSQTANWTAIEGEEVMKALLKETQDVQGIFAHNDNMALGAIAALKEAGLKPGSDVKIVSFDGTSGAFQAMLAGELNVTVECSPLSAPQVYEAGLKALNGEPLPKWIPINEGVFRSDMPNLPEIAEGRPY